MVSKQQEDGGVEVVTVGGLVHLHAYAFIIHCYNHCIILSQLQIISSSLVVATMVLVMDSSSTLTALKTLLIVPTKKSMRQLLALPILVTLELHA